LARARFHAADPKRTFGELLRSTSSHDRALRPRQNILCHPPEPLAQFRMFEMRAALGRLAIAPIGPGDTGDERARGEQRLRRGALRQRLAERARKTEQQTDRRGGVAQVSGQFQL
jgi:hypothetical protein